MPIYEYVCQACGLRAEVIQKVDDPPPAACARCGQGPMSRQVSRTSFQLKGGGWYADLYGSTPAKPADGGASAPGDGTGGPKDGGEGAKGGDGAKGADAPKADGAKASSDASPSAGSGAAASAPKPGGTSGGGT